MTRADRFAAAAEALCGAPFRLHGRDPRTGLDCVGLIASALAASGGRAVAVQGYGLRSIEIAAYLPLAAESGLAPARGPLRRGDVVLFRVGPAQHHLACLTAVGSIVHAHAGLGRVLVQPLPVDWPVTAHWRLAEAPKED